MYHKIHGVKAMKFLKIISVMVTLLPLFLFVQCSSQDPTPAATAESATHSQHSESYQAGTEHYEEHSTVNEATDIISMLEQQVKTVGIRLGSFDTTTMGSVVQTYGWLRLPPQYHARISSFLGGSVDKIFVIEGDFVRKGDTLALIASPELLELQEAYIQSLAAYRFAKAELERQRKLYQDSIAAAKQLQLAEAEFQSQQSRMLALQKRLRLANIDPSTVEHSTIVSSFPIVAPFDGYVRHINVVLGEFISPGKELFELVNNHHIHADIFVFEKDIPRVHEGQTVRFALTTQSNQWYTGRIFSVGKAFEDSVKAVIVHAELTGKYNRDLLLPGMFVNAHIITAAHRVTALPESAIVEIEGKPHIFIFTGKSDHPDGIIWQFRPVPVQVGERDRGFVAVSPLEPIPDNASIVIDGAYYIYAQTQNLEAEHAH